MPYFIKRLICLLTGLAVESFGIALITKSNLGTSPISSIAGVLSFIFFGRLDGIGLGTVIAAAFTGLIVNFINRHAHFVGPIDPRKPDQAKAQAGAETSIGTRQTERETA